MPTAAAIIIGDEILSGKFDDENGPWLVRRCRTLGIDLKRISIISDEIDTIADEVRRASSNFDFVFTTGGIGPTHDDLTLRVSRAFGVALYEHPDLADMIRQEWVTRPTKMRCGWRWSQWALNYGEPPKRFPVLVCRNVLIFPGVPSISRPI